MFEQKLATVLKCVKAYDKPQKIKPINNGASNCLFGLSAFLGDSLSQTA